MKRRKVRSLFTVPSFLLAAVMLMGLFPVVVQAGNESVAANEIISFEKLAPEVAVQKVPTGTLLSALSLPESVMANLHVFVVEQAPAADISQAQPIEEASSIPQETVSQIIPPVEENMPLEESQQEAVSQLSAKKTAEIVFLSASTSTATPVPVTWSAAPNYDGDTEGVYHFTPTMVGNFVLASSVEAPTITITVVKQETGKTVTGYTALPDNIRYQKARDVALPATLAATVDEKEVSVPIVWNSDTYSASSPTTGLHVFTGVLQEGYVWGEGIAAPVITYVSANLGRMAGLGTEQNPLQITNELQLHEIGELVNAGVLESVLFGSNTQPAWLLLMNDLDLAGYGAGYNGGLGWTPIGTNAPFKGNFDGGGHVISGLLIQNAGIANAGLFGTMVGGSVRNLGIKNASIQGGQTNTGILAGAVISGSINNCYTTGTVNGTANTGGLVGCIEGDMLECNSSAAVQGITSGGLVGCLQSGTLSESYSTGRSTGSNNAGGIAGLLVTGQVQNVYTTGVVTSTNTAGGIIGELQNGLLKQAYATASVTGKNSVGGIAGTVSGGASSRLQNCAALNFLLSGDTKGGLVAGSLSSGNIVLENVAYSGIQKSGTAVFLPDDGATTLNGAATTSNLLQGSGFFEALFSSDANWFYEAGMLPGFAAALPLPDFLLNALPFGAGDGTTAATAYEISTAKQLALLATLVNSETAPYVYADKYYMLTADIDLSHYGSNFNGGKGWIPIGRDSTYSFRGHLDGKNHTITGLYTNNSGAQYTGLFGYAVDSNFSNIGMIRANVTGNNYTGSLLGLGRYTNGTTRAFLNCYATGTVTGVNQTGGLVGGNQNPVTYNDCYAEVLVTGSGEVGGLVGAASGSVTACYATGNVTGTGSSVGGLMGSQSGVGTPIVQNSYASGTIKGVGSVGGLLGLVNIPVTVEYCHALGGVTGTGSAVGGLVGLFAGKNLTRCYATGAVSGNSAVGGIAGQIGSNSTTETGCVTQNNVALNPSVNAINNCGRVVGDRIVRNMGGVINLASFKNNWAFSGMVAKNRAFRDSSGLNNFSGLSVVASDIVAGPFLQTNLGTGGTWVLGAGSLPGFGASVDMPYHILAASGTSPFSGGDGLTAATAYQISTPKQLALLAQFINNGVLPYANPAVFYTVTADIDLSSYGKTYNGGVGWTPIGDGTKPFAGNFDGNNHTISGLYIQNPALAASGLFGVVDAGAVQNISLPDVTIVGNNSVGGVAGVVQNQSTIAQCNVSGIVQGNNHVGGMVGYATQNSIMSETCYYGFVQGNSLVGGLVGMAIDGCQVVNCYTAAEVTGQTYVGGVAGNASFNASLSSCYATGPVSGQSYVGGIAGTLLNTTNGVCGTVTDCASLNQYVTATNEYAGRVVAEKDAGQLSNNYAFSGITAQGGVGFQNDIIKNGVDGENMSKTEALQATFWQTGDNWSSSGWDSNVWILQDGKLPVFKNVAGAQSADFGLYLTPQRAERFTIFENRERFAYNAINQIPQLTIKFGDTLLKKDVDYTVAITSGDGSGTSAGMKAGTVSLTIYGIGGYAGSTSIQYVIQPSDVIVRVDSQTVYVGDKLPSPTVSYVGFQGNDTPKNALATQAVAQYTVNDSSVAGSFPITLATSASLNDTNGANYILAEKTGILTIKERPVYTITTKAGTGGTILPGNVVTTSEGEDKTIEFKPSAGYKIASVIVDGVEKGAITSFTFSAIHANHLVEVEFTRLASSDTNPTSASGGTPVSNTTVSASSRSTNINAPASGNAAVPVSASRNISTSARSSAPSSSMHASVSVRSEVEIATVTSKNGNSSKQLQAGKVHVLEQIAGNEIVLIVGEELQIATANKSLRWDESMLKGAFDSETGIYTFSALKPGETKLFYIDAQGDEKSILIRIEETPVALEKAGAARYGIIWWIIIPLVLLFVLILLILFKRRKQKEDETTSQYNKSSDENR